MFLGHKASQESTKKGKEAPKNADKSLQEPIKRVQFLIPFYMEACNKGLSKEVRMTPTPHPPSLLLQVWLFSFVFPPKSFQKPPKSNLTPY